MSLVPPTREVPGTPRYNKDFEDLGLFYSLYSLYLKPRGRDAAQKAAKTPNVCILHTHSTFCWNDKTLGFEGWRVN